MADNDLNNIKITDEMLEQAQRNIMSGIIDKAHPELTAEILKQNGAEIRKQFTEEIKKLKFEELGKKLQNELLQDVKKEFSINQGFWDKIINKLSGGSRKEDSYQEMWRVRQRFGGLEQMFSGNFKSGLSQFAGSFQSISRIMGGPYFIAIQAVITGLLKFDKALAEASKTTSSITGGLQSQYIGKGMASLAYNLGLKNDLYAIGMQGQRNELISALQKNYGYASYQNNQREFINTMAYGQKGLSAYGIESGSTNQLISNLRLLEGKNQQGIYAQLYRLTERINRMSMFSPEQTLQQTTSLYDQTKNLGTNFEWASKMVTKFERGLKDGTIALSDFAAINRSLRGGNISSNAGIASLISDYANRTGIQLPSGFANSNIIGQSYAISTKAMLSNNQFAKAYQGQIQEMLDQIGGTTKEERAGALQLILQSRGININSEMAGSAIKSNGQIDLIGQGIIGSKMGQKEDEEKREAEKYKSLVESYYKGTTSWHQQTLTKLDKIISNTGSGFAEGFDKNINPDASGLKAFGQIIGYSLREGLWKGFDEIFQNIGEMATKAPPKL